MLHLEVPGGCSEVLLHSCCAPCSGAVLECLLDNGIRPVVFFSNSNIVPFEEYELRLAELQRYCDALGVSLVADEYNHGAWLDAVLQRTGQAPDGRAQEALAKAPERGSRCFNCFKFRLQRAAEYAAAEGIPVLTTTLASSRWKSLEQVCGAGALACNAPGSAIKGPGEAAGPGSSSSGPDRPAVNFWPQNWRKGGLQERRNEVIREQGFYNQNWCGCEFSRHDNP